uniref:RNase H type-1 domain-containing protein n=1 Tax=Fagus sylvatica TaxID=28930 RepID=A0A2N9EGY2_FAGSY
MAGETSRPGPSEQEIRMVAFERKFDELLSFVQLIAKRNPDDENQRKEDDRDTNNEEPEGHSNTNTTPPPPTPPKPEGKDSQLDSKIDSLEEKIRLIQGLNSFGNTDFSSMSWFPMTMPPKFKAPEFEKYNGRGDPMIHLQMYCRKMAPYADNEPLLIQTFQDTLIGHAAKWIEDALKTKKIVDMTTLMALAEQAAKKAPTKKREGDVQTIGRNNGRPRQVLPTFTMQPIQPRPIPTPAPTQTPALALTPQMLARPMGNQPNDNRWHRKELRQFTPLPMPLTELYPILIEKNLISLVIPKPYNGPQGRDFNPNSTCDFYFGEVGHTVENCNQLRHRVQDLIDHGVLKFEGLPNITTNPLPNPPEGGVNMVEMVEEGDWFDLAGDRISWRRLFHTLEKQGHITPLETPPGPSTGDACEYHSGARGHSLECCEEFKKEVTNLMEKGLVRREGIPSEGSHQPDDPSDFDWYAELNLDDIVEDEMDLDDLMDEGDTQRYFMEDDTDEWRDVDFSELFQFPCLIAPNGFETPEFEIFYENGDPEVHLQKYGEKMALHAENELLMILVFPESLSKQAAAWFYQLRDLTDEEPYIIPDPRVNEVIMEIKEESGMSSLPRLTEEEEEEKAKPPPVKSLDNINTTAAIEEEYVDPLVEGLSIHVITKEGDSITPLNRHCQQGEEAKTWTSMPLLQRISSSNEIARKTSNDPHVSEIDNKTDCSLDNIDNSDEEVKLPDDILEALERQDEGSKPNIEELEIINLAGEGEEPREVKIRTRSTTKQKEALIALLREFHEIFAWSYQDMPGLDTDIVVHKDPAQARMQACQTSVAPNEASKYNQIKMAEEDKSKIAFVTHWGTFVYDVMPFSLKNAGATYQRAMVTLFHDMIHHEIEVYVDDMIAKSRTTQDHLTDLRKLFQQLKKYQLRLNPNKCAFGVTSGKLLGFIVSGRGIEIRSRKGSSLYEACPHQRQRKRSEASWEGINYIARFIAQLTATCEPLFKLLRKDVKIKWTEDCQKAFDKIKEYLLNPPILVPPTPGRPLILYLTVQEASMGCMLGQQDETGRKEQAIYYLSKKFTEPETHYLLVEKTCCALAWASKKLRQYMLYYTTWLVSRMDPIKYIFEKPALTGKIARMAIDEDNHIAGGSFTLTEQQTLSEHASSDLQAALEFGAYELEVFGDSLLIVSQTNGEWQARDPKLIPYQQYISRLVPKFKYITFTYTPRAHNHFADALATLASLIKLVEGDDVRPLRNRDSRHPGILHVQTCHKVPDVSELQECTSPVSPHYGLAMAFLGLGNGCDWCNSPQRRLTGMSSYWWPSTILPSGWRHVPSRMSLKSQSPGHLLEPPPTLWYIGMEAVLPVEVEIPSLRILSQTQLEEAEWAQARYEQLNFIDEKRLAALCHGQLYQRRIERAYNKKARPRTFQPGDLVLKKRNMALSDSRGKFAPSYEGPYVVKKAFLWRSDHSG